MLYIAQDTPLTTQDAQQVETSTVATDTHSEGQSSGIAALGINGSSFLFQIINFILLFLILRKFLFGPISKYLTQRSEQIQKSLETARTIEEKEKAIEVKQREVLEEARQKTVALLQEAKSTASKLKDEILAKTKAEQEGIIASAKTEIEASKQQALTDVKKELSTLVIAATGKVTEGIIDPKKDADLINKTIKGLS